MIGYKEVSRIDLMDDEGNKLSSIVETNGPTYRLFMRHLQAGEIVAGYSNWWAFTNRERAELEQREKADEAIAKGWKEVMNE
jgi:hypothetical protein